VTGESQHHRTDRTDELDNEANKGGFAVEPTQATRRPSASIISLTVILIAVTIGGVWLVGILGQEPTTVATNTEELNASDASDATDDASSADQNFDTATTADADRLRQWLTAFDQGRLRFRTGVQIRYRADEHPDYWLSISDVPGERNAWWLSASHRCGPGLSAGALLAVGTTFRHTNGQNPDGSPIDFAGEDFDCNPTLPEQLESILTNPFQVELGERSIRLFSETESVSFSPSTTTNQLDSWLDDHNQSLAPDDVYTVRGVATDDSGLALVLTAFDRFAAGEYSLLYGHVCGPTFDLGLLTRPSGEFTFASGQSPEGHDVAVALGGFACEPELPVEFTSLLNRSFDIEITGTSMRLFTEVDSFTFEIPETDSNAEPPVIVETTTTTTLAPPPTTVPSIPEWSCSTNELCVAR